VVETFGPKGFFDCGVTGMKLFGTDPVQRRVIRLLAPCLPLQEAMKVGYFTPEEFGTELLRLAQMNETAQSNDSQKRP